jgi:hypothetical protein
MSGTEKEKEKETETGCRCVYSMSVGQQIDRYLWCGAVFPWTGEAARLPTPFAIEVSRLWKT